MAIYIYDGSFDGFLTCVYNHYYENKAANITVEENYADNFLETSIKIATDSVKAEKVYSAIEEKISVFDLKKIYRVFMSSEEKKEMYLLEYIVLGFSIGNKISMFHSNDTVKRIESINHKINREIERMLGLVRFKELKSGIFYGKIETDHDILEFIAEHFAKRLNDETFIIHDKKRNKAVVCQNEKWYITSMIIEDSDKNLEVIDKEKETQNLWKEYFKRISIEERKNLRCQKNMMPSRYWLNLTEMHQ